MSGEQVIWKSNTLYIDLDTGLSIDKSEIGKSYKVDKLIEKSVKCSPDGYTKTVTRINAVKKTEAIQQELWK
jgi:hypothetical protein